MYSIKLTLHTMYVVCCVYVCAQNTPIKNISSLLFIIVFSLIFIFHFSISIEFFHKIKLTNTKFLTDSEFEIRACSLNSLTYSPLFEYQQWSYCVRIVFELSNLPDFIFTSFAERFCTHRPSLWMGRLSMGEKVYNTSFNNNSDWHLSDLQIKKTCTVYISFIAQPKKSLFLYIFVCRTKKNNFLVCEPSPFNRVLSVLLFSLIF